MARRHPIAVDIDDQACEQAQRLRPNRQRAPVAIGRELVLHSKLRIDDGRVLAGIGCATISPR